MSTPENEPAPGLNQGGQERHEVPPALYPQVTAGVKIANLGAPNDPNAIETAFNLVGTNTVRVRFRDGMMIDIDGWRLRQLANTAR